MQNPTEMHKSPEEQLDDAASKQLSRPGSLRVTPTSQALAPTVTVVQPVNMIQDHQLPKQEDTGMGMAYTRFHREAINVEKDRMARATNASTSSQSPRWQVAVDSDYAKENSKAQPAPTQQMSSRRGGLSRGSSFEDVSPRLALPPRLEGKAHKPQWR
jgi:hypothetical protein